ncbi:tRNA-intron endonuclease catalytic domain-like protein [Lichtheimia hyalospora FSU 10163]|nr:tRNA-intron endonuclease catalytic domain-like protein [Lichtheimia hyalospora FSU 10163]
MNGNEMQFLEQLTIQRRRQRRGLQQSESQVRRANQVLEATGDGDYEEYRLDLYEAFYLLYALNAIQIDDPRRQLKRLSVDDCWTQFNQCNPAFATHYAVYHYYRTLGWAPKQGSKFGVDFVLYRSGPRHMHGDFAVKIMYPNKAYNWHTLHQLARACTQVKKTLILCYVNPPTSTPHPDCLSKFEIRELIIKRWSPEKNREKWVR